MNKYNITFLKATKSISKFKDPLLQNFINQNATKLVNITKVITYENTYKNC